MTQNRLDDDQLQGEGAAAIALGLQCNTSLLYLQWVLRTAFIKIHGKKNYLSMSSPNSLHLDCATTALVMKVPKHSHKPCMSTASWPSCCKQCIFVCVCVCVCAHVNTWECVVRVCCACVLCVCVCVCVYCQHCIAREIVVIER